MRSTAVLHQICAKHYQPPLVVNAYNRSMGNSKIQCKITANQFCLELARVQVFGSQLYVIKMQFIILCKVIVLSVTETDVLMH